MQQLIYYNVVQSLLQSGVAILQSGVRGNVKGSLLQSGAIVIAKWVNLYCKVVLCEICPNAEFFLVRIFPHSD